MSQIGVVVIGRNEGERLKRCLHALGQQQMPVVYVDSGSTDDSPAFARANGVEVVELDLSIPFTAARARNEGCRRLLNIAPLLDHVQFVDGDCELADGWLKRAREELDSGPQLGIVCGRLRERYPRASVYNLLCDMEWDTPVGEAKACGGIALVRVAAFVQAGGFDPGVIAAEDDEFCLRARRLGWRIMRIDAEMATHDAAMHRFSQWWKRMMRGGYAVALGVSMHGDGPERHFVRQYRRILGWGFLLPALTLALAVPTFGLSLLLGLLYPVQMLRVYYRTYRRSGHFPAATYAVACVAGKFPEFLGICRFAVQRLRGRPARIIEYK